jgi:hypothetical protein
VLHGAERLLDLRRRQPDLQLLQCRHRRLFRHQRHLLRHRRQIDQDRLFQPVLRRLPVRGLLHARQYRGHPQHPGRRRHPPQDRCGTALYARVGYAGLTVGGAYSFRENVFSFKRDSEVYGVGATYDWSRYSIGLGWTRGRYELNSFSGAEDHHDIYALTGSFQLSPGISIDGLVGYSDYDSDFTFFDYSTIELGLGTSITF